ncbi:MAG: acyltransferase [Phycisphaerae bacterium]
MLIGNDVRLNSCNKGYHLNMYGPVKLFADRPEAVIEIGDKTRIHGSCLHAYSSIKIGSKCLIAANCNIIDCSGHDLSFDDVDNRINTNGGARPIIIEDSVWICANVTVLPGVTIGRGTVVSTGSVVSNSLPPMVLAAGNPARPILTYTKDK